MNPLEEYRAFINTKWRGIVDCQGKPEVGDCFKNSVKPRVESRFAAGGHNSVTESPYALRDRDGFDRRERRIVMSTNRSSETIAALWASEFAFAGTAKHRQERVPLASVVKERMVEVLLDALH